MSSFGVAYLTNTESVDRAKKIALLKTKYILGAGGRNPKAETPFTVKDDELGSDCIGFVLWCLGVDRYQPEDGKDIDFPFYEGWINTDSMLMDVQGKSLYFQAINTPYPGCCVVYPSIWKNGKMIRMGHIGLVIAAPKTWPSAAAWKLLAPKHRAEYMRQVTVIDCNHSLARIISGKAVGPRDATLWNKPDAKFVAFKAQKVINELPAPTMAEPKLGDRILKLTSPLTRGSDVKDLQRRLKITQDGIFGPETESFVRQFQRKIGLFEDGAVGPITLAKLPS